MTSLTHFEPKPAAALAQLQTRVCYESENTTELIADGLVAKAAHWMTLSRSLAAVCRARVRT